MSKKNYPELSVRKTNDYQIGPFGVKDTWKFEIRTGPRCMGVQSRQTYSSHRSAQRAAEQFITKLHGDHLP